MPSSYRSIPDTEELFLVSLPAANGDVVVVDLRVSPSKVENTIQCFDNSCRTLSLHPQDEHLFMVCNRYGYDHPFFLTISMANVCLYVFIL